MNLPKLIEKTLSSSGIFTGTADKIASGERHRVSGISGSLGAFLAAHVLRNSGKPLLAVTDTLVKAEALRDDLETILGEDSVLFFPPAADGHGQESLSLLALRTQALGSLLAQAKACTVTTFDGLLDTVPEPSQMKKRTTIIKLGEERDMSSLIASLVETGFEPMKMVSAPFELSSRGGILDIFPVSRENPVRIEFFGDTVDSIREFSVITQRSKNTLESIEITPNVDDLRNATDAATIFSYLDDDALLWIDSPERLEAFLIEKGVENPDELLGSIRGHPGVDLADFASKDAFHLDSVEQTAYKSSIELLTSDIAGWLSGIGNKNIFIACENAPQVERMSHLLENNAVPVGVAPLSGGFHLHSIGFHLLTDHRIFDRHRKRRSFSRFGTHGTPVCNLTTLSPGDFLVHIDHGIGVYSGLDKIKIAGALRECIRIVYKDDDKIFLPVENFQRVQKYSAAEGIKPSVNRLGAGDWEKLKRKTKASIEKIARDLVELYAARIATKGYSFSPDSDLQWAVESSFPYDETPDQLVAADEVKHDMEKAAPMDRLLCGDVGFGKTEVAIRAAFKSALDGKQVAVLVPTTILAEQHYQTFTERFEPFPVVVESLSRFRTKKQQTRILERLAEGKVDILIGTHRILSADVSFRNLGLIIVDEEQRFGVRHKENLKRLRLSVDVLTMTATPIPRTLNFSLLGARDLSTIDTPPKNRLPIYTEIAQLNQGVVRDAILKEIERGGQVFFVHNRVRTIEQVAISLKRWVPQADFCIAHGQMKARELEQVMMEFLHREHDVLVSTMIIESGLDIPNVNTILINRADTFGLAQLYQLRGRVGRSDRRAFAYLLVPPVAKLSTTAVRRLKTLESFTQLGSGFNVAMHDLEIRGAGNLLGTEQSGFISAVGFDLYNRLVREAVNTLKHERGLPESKKERIETEVSCDVDAFIPESYVEDGEARIDFYKRLADSVNVRTVEEIIEELKDRYGRLPAEASNLATITEIKILASMLDLSAVTVKKNFIKGVIAGKGTSDHDLPFLKALSKAGELDGFNIRIQDSNDLSFIADLIEKNKLASAKSLLNKILS